MPIDFRKNASVLAAVHAVAKPKQRTPGDPYVAPINLLFVVGESNGTLLEFTGSAKVANGTITGTGSCSTTTPLCQGVTGTFSATLQ